MSDLTRFDARVEGDKVLVSFNRRIFVELSYQAAFDVAKALTACARRLEELAKADAIIKDSAILMRAGMPFSLSSDRKILEEAAKEAAWNKDLRRYMPGNVKSEEIVGTPTLVKR